MKLFSVLKKSEHCYLSSIIGEYRHIESYDKETAKLKGQPNFFSNRMIKHNKFTVYRNRIKKIGTVIRVNTPKELLNKNEFLNGSVCMPTTNKAQIILNMSNAALSVCLSVLEIVTCLSIFVNTLFINFF